MSLRVWLLLLTLSLVWGTGFFFADIALQAVPPLTVAWSRVVLGALFLLAMLRLSGGPWPERWRDYVVMGLLNNALPRSVEVARGRAQPPEPGRQVLQMPRDQMHHALGRLLPLPGHRQQP